LAADLDAGLRRLKLAAIRRTTPEVLQTANTPTLDQIGMPHGGRVGFGGADAFAATHPFDADSPHQPGDLIAADGVAGATCCFPQLASPVDTVVVLSELAQRRTQHRVAAGAC
jgi:hypothetical protein